MEKQTYVVAEGIQAINGKPVPKSRVIALTAREALFDLSLGRIEPKPAESARAAGRKSQEALAQPNDAAAPGADEA